MQRRSVSCRCASPESHPMIRHLLVVLLAIAAASCSRSPEGVDTSSIHGRWEIVVVQGFPAAEDCRKIALEIDATTIVTYSGNLVVKASYRAGKTEHGWRMDLFDISNNGARNCQGIPADYVMSHLVNHMDLDMIDGRMRVYFPDRESGSYTDFVRTH